MLWASRKSDRRKDSSNRTESETGRYALSVDATFDGAARETGPCSPFNKSLHCCLSSFDFRDTLCYGASLFWQSRLAAFVVREASTGIIHSFSLEAAQWTELFTHKNETPGIFGVFVGVVAEGWLMTDCFLRCRPKKKHTLDAVFSKLPTVPSHRRYKYYTIYMNTE